ncbi:hypothetical protein N7456_001732 [Penicillium angulare]|uniref:HNH nuclease domain-containing protein n=1 Tax=Penicillium angulare TaxID=116970 RepID=A0A9W9G6Y3_9EURO|nr:hypothetical protein N7456_001732 [Penicillium angulare]
MHPDIAEVYEYLPTGYDNKHIHSELEDPERTDLVERFQKLGDYRAYDSRFAFWTIWLSDLGDLRQRVEEYEDMAAKGLETPDTLDFIGRPCGDILGLLMPVQLQCPESPVKSLTYWEQGTLEIRDNCQCPLTGLSKSAVKVAHIMPSHLHHTTESLSNPDWKLLRGWMGPHRLDLLRAKILVKEDWDPEPIFDTDRPMNMITLASEVLHHWNNDLCAFRPVSVKSDGTSMDIAFHWLPLPERGTVHYSDDSLHILKHPNSYEPWGCDCTPGAGMFLYDAKGRMRIRSGTIFTMTTADPVRFPLPSMTLLEIQWYVKRLARFKGNLKIWEDKFDKVKENPEDSVDGVYWRYRDRIWDDHYRGNIYNTTEASYGDTHDSQRWCEFNAREKKNGTTVRGFGVNLNAVKLCRCRSQARKQGTGIRRKTRDVRAQLYAVYQTFRSLLLFDYLDQYHCK